VDSEEVTIVDLACPIWLATGLAIRKRVAKPEESTDTDVGPSCCWVYVAGNRNVKGLEGGAKTLWGNAGGLAAGDDDTRRIVRMTGDGLELTAADNNAEAVEEMPVG
jgi:hypothetical protein